MMIVGNRIWKIFMNYLENVSIRFLREKDRDSKLLRVLPDSFAPFALVVQTSDLSLDHVIIAVEREFSRRLNSDDNRRMSTKSNDPTLPSFVV